MGRNLPILLCICVVFLAACVKKPEGIGDLLSWAELKGWEQDQMAEVWPAFLQSCKALQSKAEWQAICQAAEGQEGQDHGQIRGFFQQWFEPYEVISSQGKRSGLITGYYSPVLFGSTIKDSRYRYPVYREPDNLLRIDLGALYPDLANRRLRGRLQGNRVVPFFSREDIEKNRQVLSGEEILWVDDPVALFFLHIQGSGRVKLPDERVLSIGYANQNGHPYVAIGKLLVEKGAMKLEEVSLQTIKKWLAENPDGAEEILNGNPSYVFFRILDEELPGPLGSLNVPLTAGRSIAIDRRQIPLGYPVWLETTLPNKQGQELIFNNLVMAQDTGGAINGAARADLYIGEGLDAEWIAGQMKQAGKLYVLKPKQKIKTVRQSQ